MLTRLEIDGFKTFEDFAVDLYPFTVVLGTNASGKSNLFDAIRLLAALASRDVAEAVKEMRGEPLELFRLTEARRSSRITMAAEVLVDPEVRDPWGSVVALTHTRMRYELTLERREVRPGFERIQVAREVVTPILRKDDVWAKGIKPSRPFAAAHLKYGRTKPWLTTDQVAEGPAFSIHQDGRQGRNRPANEADATVLYSMTNAEFPHLFALREEMRQWRLLQLAPALLRRPAPVTAASTLDADGGNLAAVLAELKAETATEARPDGVLADIAAELNHLIPGVAGLDAKLHDASREYRIELKMRDGLSFTSRVVSDGTLRVLALLTLLHDPRHRGLVCFEEPENGVHPSRIRQLVHQLRDMATVPSDFSAADSEAPLSQLLLNSHSPVVLSALLDRERRPIEGGSVLFADVAVVTDPDLRQQRRRTRLRPIDPAAQRAFHTFGAAPTWVSDLEVSKLLDTAPAGEA